MKIQNSFFNCSISSEGIVKYVHFSIFGVHTIINVFLSFFVYKNVVYLDLFKFNLTEQKKINCRLCDSWPIDSHIFPFFNTFLRNN